MRHRYGPRRHLAAALAAAAGGLVFGLSAWSMPSGGTPQSAETGAVAFAAPPGLVSETTDLGALARALANPVHRLSWASVDADYRGYAGDLPGAEKQTGLALRFNGGLAKVLDSGRHWQFRLSVPVNLDLPAWVVNFDDPIWELNRDYADFLLRQSPQVTASTGRFASSHGHLADVRLDVAYGHVDAATGRSWSVGVATEWPSSQDQSVSCDQGLLGPDLALGLERGWGVVGARLTHWVNVAGDDRFDTNETRLEASLALDLRRGWQLLARPAVLRDWEADSGNDVLVPLTAGLGKTFRVGRWPVRAVGEATWYARTADRFGVDWQIRLGVTTVFGGAR